MFIFIFINIALVSFYFYIVMIKKYDHIKSNHFIIFAIISSIKCNISKIIITIDI